MIAPVAALALLVSACGDDGGPDTTAAACSTQKLEGLAAGAPAVRGKTVTAAGAVHGLQAQAKPVVKVGMYGDLTGANSSLVIHSRDAMKLAFEQANAAGNLKVTLQLVDRDNKDALPDTAPAIEQGFIQDQAVVAVMGGAFSGETRAVGKLFQNAGLVHVSQSATGIDLTKQGWPFFRVLPNDAVQGPQAGDLLTKVLGCTKIAVIDDKSEYGKGIADVVEKTVKAAGATVVERQGIEPTTDYTTIIDSLLAAAPDGVFYGGYDSEFSLIVKQAKDKGLNALLASGDGSKGDKLLAIGADADGAVVACPCLDPNVSTEAAAKKFATDFQAKYGRDAGIYAAEGWDAAQVVIAAIDASDEDGKVTRAEVLAAVPTVQITGVTKPIKFTSDGEVEDETIFAYLVKGGKFTLIGPIAKLG